MTATAMCCGCGNVRRTSLWQGMGEVDDDWDIFDDYSCTRCLVWRKCEVCAEVTRHAYLRPDDNRDELEQLLVGVDVTRAADEVVARLQVEHALAWLGDRGVTVVWDAMTIVDEVGAVLRHRLGDGTFVLVLPPGLAAGALAVVLEQVVRVLESPTTRAQWCVVPAGAPYEAGAFCVFEQPAVGVRW